MNVGIEFNTKSRWSLSTKLFMTHKKQLTKMLFVL
jgi:hypothetical protein